MCIQKKSSDPGTCGPHRAEVGFGSLLRSGDLKVREFPLATHAFVEAVRHGDIVAVRALLQAAPELVPAARKMTGESIVLPAVFRRRLDVAVLVAERTELDAFEAAAVGCIPRLVTLLESNPAIVRERMANGWTIAHL